MIEKLILTFECCCLGLPPRRWTDGGDLRFLEWHHQTTSKWGFKCKIDIISNLKDKILQMQCWLSERSCVIQIAGEERVMLEKDLITCIYRIRRNGDKGTKAKHQSHNSRKRNCNSELQGPQLSFTHDMDEKNWILRIILTIWLDFGNIDWITVEERNYIDWITLEEKNNFFLSFEMLYWGSLDPMR